MGESAQYLILYLFDELYFVAHSLMAATFVRYALYLYNINPLNTIRKELIYFVPYAVIMLLCLTNPWTDWVFSIEGLEHVRGQLMPVVYVLSFSYFLYGIYCFIRYRGVMLHIRLGMLLWLTFISLVGIVIQAVIPELQIELFLETSALIGFLLTSENLDADLDSHLQIYNRDCMMKLLTQLRRRGIPFTVIRIFVQNMGAMLYMLPPDRAIELRRNTADALSRIFGTENLFSYDPTTFTALLPDDQNVDREEKLALLRERFSAEWKIGEEKGVFLNALIVAAHVPTELLPESVENMLETRCESPFRMLSFCRASRFLSSGGTSASASSCMKRCRSAALRCGISPSGLPKRRRSSPQRRCCV